jgi:hypothetical protein
MAGFIINVSFEQPAEAVFGFVLLAFGLPLYWWSEAGSRRRG